MSIIAPLPEIISKTFEPPPIVNQTNHTVPTKLEKRHYRYNDNEITFWTVVPDIPTTTSRTLPKLIPEASSEEIRRQLDQKDDDRLEMYKTEFQEEV